MYKDATTEEINAVMEEAWKAFLVYRNTTLKQRAALMRSIAEGLENLGDELLEIAARETALPESRLRVERTRTMFQLTSYAEACEAGNWLEARVDHGDPGRNPPRPDMRKMRIAIGPVAVFGAANFPFAYSTAGGDTASALAAGCPVIVKAHPAHPETSEWVAGAIHRAVASHLLPPGVFSHIHGSSHEVGKNLIEHSRLRAVGFTGSRAGGRQLFDWASQRPDPIPVFAEMSSINPVILLPGKLKESATPLAEMLASSMVLGVGQFCTNPGILIAIDNEGLENFTRELAGRIRHTSPGTMLNAGIFKNYVERRANALSQTGVETIAVAEQEAQFNEGMATIASVPAEVFLGNPVLHQEVFGPYSLIIKCRDLSQIMQVVEKMEGQLTASILATDEDLSLATELVHAAREICGRLILNGVPTGVEVTAAQHHGGPWPATTDSRFTSVGEDAIKRFSRPIAFQNWPDHLLPDELKNDNPLRMPRMEQFKG